MFLRRSLLVMTSLILVMSAAVFAQEPQTPMPDRGPRPERMRGERGRRHDRIDGMSRKGFGHFRGISELNLSEEQKQQQRAIMQRQLEATKAQREELFKLREKRIAGALSADEEARAKALREEIHKSMQGIHSEIEATLTSEQRAKLEELKAERKTRHEGMLKRRQERRQNNPQ